MDPSSIDPPPAAVNHPTPEQLNIISPATNPAPNNGHNYPSYPEMISAAIGALREQEGSSRQAIAKYIEQVFTNLPADNAALLTRHLKWMKQAGQLVMVKHSYALPGSVPIQESDVVIPTPVTSIKRRPGRPPKLRNENHNHQLVVSSPVPIQEAVFLSLGLMDEPVPIQDSSAPPLQSVLGKRGRGRPPKLKTLTFPTDQMGPIADQLSPTGDLKRKPGRPRKIDSIARIMPRLVQKPSGSNPRGRPRKYVVLPVATINGGEAQASVGVTPVKRRGRKKGSSMKKARRLSGKPLGRPRKTMLLESAPTNDDLVRRLEHIQGKIKQVVNAVKPHLDTTTTAYALRSLQELEQLARQSLYAPFSIQNNRS
ncbi:uncharacterized protein LOC124941141 isoform X2 [Impatiens glandulifera]|uniref:uncharacterized protein LOC124941141 isoform X2 n=1 Tax=Impatiens glandulifera TaxID=253017 RepID=UPI001FB17A3A|nr:uncharacterized protein LOC124941141 isoform X2 [Impatiens glandulifera]